MTHHNGNAGQTAKSQDQLDQALQFFNTAFGYLTTLLEMGDDEYEELHKLAKPTIADGSDEDDAPPARPVTTLSTTPFHPLRVWLTRGH